MNKQQKLKIALPALAVVMVFVWGPILAGSGSKRKVKGRAVQLNVPAAQARQDIDLAAFKHLRERKKAKTSYANWGRNPFLLSNDSGDLILEGVVWDEKSPKAIINGNIVGVGDQIGSFQVILVRHDSVVIKDDTQEIELRL